MAKALGAQCFSPNMRTRIKDISKIQTMNKGASTGSAVLQPAQENEQYRFKNIMGDVKSGCVVALRGSEDRDKY